MTISYLFIEKVEKVNRDEVNNPCDYHKEDKKIGKRIGQIWTVSTIQVDLRSPSEKNQFTVPVRCRYKARHW